MARSIYLLLKQLDIFGITPLFTIRGASKFQTYPGSFLTIICISLIFLYILFYLTEMINHKKPYLHSSMYYEEQIPEIQLNKNNFSFAFSLENNEYKHYIDESIYKINAFQTSLFLQNDGSYKSQNENLKIIKCNEINFDLILDYNQKLPLDNLFCIENNIILKGEYKDPIWNYITLNFSKCENSTTNNNSCKSEIEINNLLNEGFIGIYISDNIFLPYNFNHPLKLFIKNLYKPFSLKYFEDIFLYLKIVHIETDIGYFFEDKKSIISTSYDYIQDDKTYENSTNFISLKIRLSSKKEFHQRDYIKIQTIFSNVGGMLKVIILFGEYIVYFIKITLYKNYILEFFNLDESAIRLKEVRKIYKLKLKHQNQINSIFNISNSPVNNSSMNINNSVNFKYRGINVISPTNNLLNTKNSKTMGNNIFDDKEKEFNRNNYIDNNSILFKDLSKEKKKKSFLVKTKTDNLLKLPDFFKDKALSKDSKTKVPPIVYFDNYFLTTPRLMETKKLVSSKLLNREDYHKRKDAFNYSLEKNKNNISIPKTKLRIIKVPNFCSDFVCKRYFFQTVKKVHENYKQIQFLLDIVHYLKTENEINIIEKYFFNEEQRKILSYTYSFEADFELEKKGYDYMIKHKKSQFDENDFKSIVINNKNNFMILPLSKNKI